MHGTGIHDGRCAGVCRDCLARRRRPMSMPVVFAAAVVGITRSAAGTSASPATRSFTPGASLAPQNAKCGYRARARQVSTGGEIGRAHV